MLIFDLNNSAATSDELLRGHLPLGVLDDRDTGADLRDRLQRQLDARELVT